MACGKAVCISMSSSNRHGQYRFSCDGDVFYVEAHKTASLQNSDYGFPPAVRKLLTPRPSNCNWADIEDGNRVTWKFKSLKGVEHCWHSTRIDLRDLQPVKSLTAQVWLCMYESQFVIAKIARFEFEIPHIEQESRIYQLIEGQSIGPRFLGYLMEKNRIMGILLEYVAARPACISDLERCLEVLKRLHELGVLMNDTNRFNFLVTGGERVLICDFSNSQLAADMADLKREEDDLPRTLLDDYYDDNEWDDGKDRIDSIPASDYRI
jgi:hypothetical protein